MYMIAFDIDGCINCLDEVFWREGEKFFEGRGFKFHPEKYSAKEIWEGATEEDLQEFYNTCEYDMLNEDPREGVREVIQYLKDNNLPACYITARHPEIVRNGHTIEEITRNWLKKHDLGLPLYFCHEKDVLAKELGVQLFVEDCPEFVEKLQKVTEVLIFTHDYNKDCEGTHVYDWREVLEHIKRVHGGE